MPSEESKDKPRNGARQNLVVTPRFLHGISYPTFKTTSEEMPFGIKDCLDVAFMSLEAACTNKIKNWPAASFQARHPKNDGKDMASGNPSFLDILWSLA